MPCAKVIDTCNLATVVMFAEDIQQEESPCKSKPVAMALQNTVCITVGEYICLVLQEKEWSVSQIFIHNDCFVFGQNRMPKTQLLHPQKMLC